MKLVDHKNVQKYVGIVKLYSLLNIQYINT